MLLLMTVAIMVESEGPIQWLANDALSSYFILLRQADGGTDGETKKADILGAFETMSFSCKSSYDF